MATDEEIKEAVRKGVKKCRVQGGAPVGIFVREADIEHITHMVTEEVLALIKP